MIRMIKGLKNTKNNCIVLEHLYCIIIFRLIVYLTSRTSTKSMDLKVQTEKSVNVSTG